MDTSLVLATVLQVPHGKKENLSNLANVQVRLPAWLKDIIGGRKNKGLVPVFMAVCPKYKDQEALMSQMKPFDGRSIKGRSSMKTVWT